MPSAYTYLDGQSLKIFKAEALPENTNQPPGTIGAAGAAGLTVAAADGYVILKDVQLAGKKRMLVSDFLRGHHLNPGSVLQ
jgi:methionyl-tRNA formyltransferase